LEGSIFKNGTKNEKRGEINETKNEGNVFDFNVFYHLG
jgi:hypothetical protein